MALFGQCPGQSNRCITVALKKCENCGYEVEIFSNELRAKCPKCGKYVFREKTPSCIDWCPAAKECIGEKKWKELKGKK